jgi:ribosomal protein S18 acetylase RimI-like enzyme
MKSKELKTLRKKLILLNKLSMSNDWLAETLPLLPFDVTWDKKDNSDNKYTNTLAGTEATTTTTTSTTLSYKSSHNISQTIFQQCLDLFRENMSSFYQDSSWGLDMSEKEEEFHHDHARFLLVFASSSVLAAFVHFRFEYDHEQYPTCGVLYVYELQVSKHYQGKGLGKSLMEIVHDIGRQQYPTVISKIVLTVFKNNSRAIKFYKQTLGYIIDETDPSHCQFEEGQCHQEDYEILSLPLNKNL